MNASGEVEMPVPIEDELSVDDEADEEEEEVSEPRFKYEMMKEYDVKQLFAKETATAIAAHDKFVVVGTSTGSIWIMDHLGNVDHANVPVYHPHRVAVTRLVIEPTGKYVMSAANDGRVVIQGILCNELNHASAFLLIVEIVPDVARSIGLSSEFARPNSGNVFVVADRNLQIHQKGMFGYFKKIVFRGTERDGFITRISVQGPYVAFTNEQGTRFYDRSLERLLSLVHPKHDVDRYRSNKHAPHHCWLDEVTLAIGWADTFLIAKIVTKDDMGVRHRHVEITRSWRLDIFVSGLSYTIRDKKYHEMVVLGLKIDKDGGLFGDFCDTASMTSSTSADPGPILEVLVLEPLGFDKFDLHAEDRIMVPLKPRTTPAQCHLAALPHDGLYFLLAPHFFVYAVPLAPDDKIRWRVDNRMLESAWELAVASSSDDKQRVGREMIEKFIEENRAKYASSRLREVCGEDKDEWEYFVGVWKRERMLTLLADVVPTSKPQLDPENYEEILNAALFNDVALFRKLILTWNPDIYAVGAVEQAIIARLDDASKNIDESSLEEAEEKALFLTLAHINIYERKFENAITIYLELKDKQIFPVIEKYSLFDLVKEKISDLMSIDTHLALRLLLDNADSVPASAVMSKIHGEPRLQIVYLNTLFARNEGVEFYDQAIRLYAEHDRKKLLPFLRKAEPYNIKKALQICKEKGFVEEMIFLLGKSGNRIEALNVMVNMKKMQLEMAIAFCREYDDADLWNYLVDEIVKRPQHMKQLLSSAGSSIDPLSIIQKLPLDLEVPNLRDLLTKILSDYAAQVELQRGCQAATLADARSLFGALIGLANTAFQVNPRTRCSLCGSFVFDPPGGDLRLFACGHALHGGCAHALERKAAERSLSVRARADPSDGLDCPVCTDDPDAE